MRKRFVPNSKYVKYRDGTWIECRKRIYLYWFKFLRHAEESSEHKVQWNKYRAWGGKDIVMNTKFDAWWEEHWKDCFGIDEETGRCKFHIDKGGRIFAHRSLSSRFYSSSMMLCRPQYPQLVLNNYFTPYLLGRVD